MSQSDWPSGVATVIRRALDKKRPLYLDVVDDVVAGLSAPAIEDKYGSHDLLISALAHVTMTLQGRGRVLPLSKGGWYARDGDTYSVAPGFSAAWKAVRG